MTPRVLWLGAGVLEGLPIEQPRLDQLGRSTSLYILDGAEIVYLAPSGTSA